MTGNSSLEKDPKTGIAGKYLTFVLGTESYGIPVLKVREIIKLVPITSVPQMPSYIKGIINLRGKIIPTVDLRAKFGLAESDQTGQACIVVVQVDSARVNKLPLGLMVDAVEEVIHITAVDIEAAPDFGTAVDTAYISGMAKVKGTVKILLDMDRLLADAALVPMA